VTDLVDSTALVESLGDCRAAEIFESFDRVARDLLVQHNGLEIDKTDGFLLVFDRPIDAVLYALAVHDALADLSKQSHVKLAVRAGIHLGEVVLRRNRPEHVARGAKPLEIEGLAKPAAARIMSLAQGSQTLMTRSAFDLARRAATDHSDIPVDIDWLDHGVYRFKGINETQSVHEVGRAGLAPRSAPPSCDKAWRVTTRGGREDSGWRPAAGREVAGRSGWRLERKLAGGFFAEVWLARAQRTVSSTEHTIGIDGSDVLWNEPIRRALLFYRTPSEERAPGAAPTWQLSDPIACVVITSGDQEGTYVILTKKTLVGGRDPSVELRINDPSVSRRHFEIRAVDDGYVICELQAKNGVVVNGKRINCDQRLENTDKIRVGRSLLVFYQDDYRGSRAGQE
jgi:class 3 adenylate cyclase